uniref:Uncharacterized protein n=1 Tax=Spirodela intermedia TaxID=51605 RepID=A0A8S0WMA9_SPIIN
MDWCGSSTPRTPEYRTMNKEKDMREKHIHIGRAEFLVFHVVKQLNNENRWRMPDRIDQVMMPQLHTSLHFHLTPIVMINGSSCRDLILDSQYFCHSIPAGQRTRRCLGYATGGSGEVGIGEHSSWGKAQSQSQGTVKLHRVFLSSAVAPGTRTLARGIFSTPSYPEKSRSPCVLEPITIFRLT